MSPFELQQCVRSAQGGNREAFDDLAAAFLGVIYKTARAVLQNSSEIDDLVQEVLLKTWQTLGQLREPERFAGWLRTTTRNLALNFRARRKCLGSIDQEMLGSVPADSPAPLDRMVQGEVAALVRRNVETLGELHRTAIDAFYWDEDSIEEISVREEAPRGTIRRRLHDARKRLGDRLVQHSLFEGKTLVAEGVVEVDELETVSDTVGLAVRPRPAQPKSKVKVKARRRLVPCLS